MERHSAYVMRMFIYSLDRLAWDVCCVCYARDMGCHVCTGRRKRFINGEYGLLCDKNFLYYFFFLPSCFFVFRLLFFFMSGVGIHYLNKISINGMSVSLWRYSGINLFPNFIIKMGPDYITIIGHLHDAMKQYLISQIVFL